MERQRYIASAKPNKFTRERSSYDYASDQGASGAPQAAGAAAADRFPVASLQLVAVLSAAPHLRQNWNYTPKEIASRKETGKWTGKGTRADPCMHRFTRTQRASHVLTDGSIDGRVDEREMELGWGETSRMMWSGLAVRVMERAGVRKKIEQLHGEASGAAWFPFKEGE